MPINEKWINSIIKKTNFNIDKEIYRGFYYSKNRIRNIIYSGAYKNKKAVLKIYNDPRVTDEPLSLQKFNKMNKSKIIVAPKLFDYTIKSPHSGWIIMEELPKKAKNLTSPLNKEGREEFLNIYLEYRKNFSDKPTRELTLIENLSPNKFHIFRINRWLELASNKELEAKRKTINYQKLVRLLERGIKIIDKEFPKRKMIWCHGHFKPKEIFKVNENLYYLTDFAHTHLFPEGYELTFMLWADYLIPARWDQSYGKWSVGVIDWIQDLHELSENLKIKRHKDLLRASLIERVIGTILADVLASDRPFNEKYARIKLLTKLLEEIMG